jgi:hypothetical protein
MNREGFFITHMYKCQSLDLWMPHCALRRTFLARPYGVSTMARPYGVSTFRQNRRRGPQLILHVRPGLTGP